MCGASAVYPLNRCVGERERLGSCVGGREGGRETETETETETDTERERERGGAKRCVD